MVNEKPKKRATDIIPISPEKDFARKSLLDSGFIQLPITEAELAQNLGGIALNSPENILIPDSRLIHSEDTLSTGDSASHSNIHTLNLDDVVYYAYAMDRVADYCRRTSPTSIISPLRGSYPPTRILVRLLENFSGPIKYVPTSNFVEDREAMIYENLDGCVTSAYNSGRDSVHIFTVDLARSGTSTKRYIYFLKEFIPQIIKSRNIPEGFHVQYSLVKLWQKPAEVGNNPKRIKTSNPSRGGAGGNQYCIDQGVFFIPDWLSEDKPDLLGIDYTYNLPDKRGVKLSFAKIVHTTKPIVLVSDAGEQQVYLPTGDQSTADVFVDIVSAMAKEIAGGMMHVPSRYQ